MVYDKERVKIKFDSLYHVRFVWNKAVGAFNEKQEIPDLLALKAEFTFLSDVSAAILQQKNRDFIEFKQQFLNKNRKTKVHHPRFKKKGEA
jgi:hypothetical protein